MKRGKKELKARMVALQQKNNRKISRLDELLGQKEALLFEARTNLLTTSAQLNDALIIIGALKKKKWYQFIPISRLEL